ncbi:hypothetical protein diail_10869 [Diaporthe ilicicola]|nr:hypothetical protein diail_10869 [Diaporthe ilicicola]
MEYFRYKQEIARMAAVGIKAYSFSISWSRILPFGLKGTPVNKEGIDHYDDLIIIEHGMTAVVTLHHFDSPLAFLTNDSWQGWDHPEYVESFVNYAQIVLAHYADRVGTWISMNEANSDASNSHNWKSSRNILMAHAKTVNWYRENINGTANWSIKFHLGLTGGPLPLDPSSQADISAAQRRFDFTLGFMLDPLIHGRDISQSIKDTLGDGAPLYTPEDLSEIRGTVDFLAIDIYSNSYETSLPGGGADCQKNTSDPDYPYCTQTTNERAGWFMGQPSNSGTPTIYQHTRTYLKFLTSEYPTKAGMVITEFGWNPWYASSMTEAQERMEMSQSIEILSMLSQVLLSIHEDRVPVSGALVWAAVNNWEWGQYDDHYGVQYIDRTTFKTMYKRSIFDLVDFMNGNLGYV